MMLPPVINFTNRYITNKESSKEFDNHVRLYANIYDEKVGFEIDTTDRYISKSGRVEACVIARKEYTEGEKIEKLIGSMIPIQPDEKGVWERGRDFSIVVTSRSKECLMLGPARFVNHDCNANCRFSTAGVGGLRMSLIATRNINIGEEITVMYGDDYFGKDNRECLCLTCEREHKGAFAPRSYYEAMDLNKPTEEIPDDRFEELDNIMKVYYNKIRNKRERSKLERESSNEKENINITINSYLTPEIISAGDHEYSALKESNYFKQQPSKSLDYLNSDTNLKPVERDIKIKYDIHDSVSSPSFNSESSNGERQLRRRRETTPMNFSLSLRAFIDKDNSIWGILGTIPKHGNRESDSMFEKRKVRILDSFTKIQTYSDTEKCHLYECGNCGVYFPSDQVKVSRYCSRCFRHARLYETWWPKTKKEKIDLKTANSFGVIKNIEKGPKLEDFAPKIRKSVYEYILANQNRSKKGHSVKKTLHSSSKRSCYSFSNGLEHRYNNKASHSKRARSSPSSNGIEHEYNNKTIGHEKTFINEINDLSSTDDDADMDDYLPPKKKSEKRAPRYVNWVEATAKVEEPKFPTVTRRGRKTIHQSYKV